MQSSAELCVSVVYALPERQVIVDLTVPEGCTAEQAIRQSKVLERFPEIAQKPLNCAVYNRLVPLTHRLENGDRVEVLRPLLIDPKENRRQTAAKSAKKPRLG